MAPTVDKTRKKLERATASLKTGICTIPSSTSSGLVITFVSRYEPYTRRIPTASGIIELQQWQLAYLTTSGVWRSGSAIRQGVVSQFEPPPEEVASGVYLYQLRAGSFTSTRKMILVQLGGSSPPITGKLS